MAKAENIGLCLSGGGFRATLFHLGVLRCIRDAGLLPRLRFISSVSGGSILGAHLVLNWDRYSGTAEQFDQATTELLRFAQLNIRGRILRRLVPVHGLRASITLLHKVLGSLLTGHANLSVENLKDRLTSTGLLNYYYSSLYHDALLADLPIHKDHASPTSGPPELHILGTNITKGTICSFNGRGFLSSENAPHHCGRDIIRVSQAVAASSAFPGLFNPVHLCRDDISWDLEELPTEHQYIADAGIVDNLGLSMFLQVQREADLDFIVVSDATGHVDWAVARRMRYTIGSALRTLEILTGQSTKLQKGGVYQDFISAKEDWTPVYVFVEVSRCLDESPVVNQTSLKHIRTDLDRFSSTEIFALVQHGYQVAKDTVLKIGFVEQLYEEVPDHWPLGLLGKERKRPDLEHLKLSRGDTSRLGLKSWANDWLVWLVVIGFAIALPSVFFAMKHKYDQSVARELLLEREKSQSVARELLLEREKSIDRFKARAPSLVEPYNYEQRTILGRPDHRHYFEILEHISLFDLRNWQPAPDPPPYSPVTLTRVVRVRKKEPAEYFRFQVRTSGEVYLDSIRKAKVYKGDRAEKTGGKDLWPHEIVLDVSDIDKGEVETLAFEATFHNAFQRPNQWWAGVTLHEQTPRFVLVVVFPKKRPFQEGTRCAIKLEEDEEDLECKESGDLIEAEDGTHLYWQVDGPRFGVTYALYWKWSEPPIP